MRLSVLWRVEFSPTENRGNENCRSRTHASGKAPAPSALEQTIGHQRYALRATWWLRASTEYHSIGSDLEQEHHGSWLREPGDAGMDLVRVDPEHTS